VWVETEFERHMNQRLVAELGQERATSMCSQFVVARNKVLHEIKNIHGVEPQLSDHGPDHISNVLDNVMSLISSDHSIHGLTARELYILGLVVLFHDVGNLFGREDHHTRIGEVFDWARGSDSVTRREKTLILRAASAHTGVTKSGSKNTLAEVDPSEHFEGKPVALRSIAAILRLADELAEGPQRTTEFFRTNIGYEPPSQKFHQYAACTHVSADRASGRLRLTYELQLDDFELPANTARVGDLVAFLEFIFHRVSKLDDERRYTRFYCPLLDAFRQTDVAINFYSGSRPLEFGLNFQLDDLVVPGQGDSTFNSRLPGKCSPPKDIASEAVRAATEGAGQ
jgi:hypothetical protein